MNDDKEAGMRIWGKSCPGRKKKKNCTCKGPAVGMSSACWRNRWKVHQAGVKRTRTGCYKVKPERGSGAGS